MDREWLKRELEGGRSIQSLAQEIGRDASTVSYWVRKHGLQSAHAERHAARGGLAREALELLVEAGATSREIAEEIGVSQSTVRHWLKRYGLRTQGAEARRVRVVPTDLSRASAPRHPRRGRLPVAAGRLLAVAEAGGGCAHFGYDRSIRALHFHHVDPEMKRFHLSYGGFARSLAAARMRSAKCVLLCANCHAEVEAGIATLVPAPEPLPG